MVNRYRDMVSQKAPKGYGNRSEQVTLKVSKALDVNKSDDSLELNIMDSTDSFQTPLKLNSSALKTDLSVHKQRKSQKMRTIRFICMKFNLKLFIFRNLSVFEMFFINNRGE